MKSLFASLAVVAAVGAPMTALAAFPEKPIEIVVPFNAGGGTDIMTRIFAEHLAEALDSPVVVVNRPGAGGEVGMTEVAEADPDGYKLIVINTPNVLTIPVEREARFSVDSFDLLGTIAEDPGTLSVHEDSEIMSIEELAAVAGAAPEEITFGTAGVGSAGHIAVLLFEQAADVSMRHIPYSGSSEVRTGLLNGDIMVATANLGEALTFADGQPWRILGVMASERVASQPDLPTFAEAGYPITAGSLRGLGAPAGTPDDVLDTLRGAMAEVMASEAFIEASAEANVPLRYLDHEAHAATLAESSQSIQALWEKTPWRE
jgi:tripartite-type tricarboxylate transporter receptor subunit TctC